MNGEKVSNLVSGSNLVELIGGVGFIGLLRIYFFLLKMA